MYIRFFARSTMAYWKVSMHIRGSENGLLGFKVLIYLFVGPTHTLLMLDLCAHKVSQHC